MKPLLIARIRSALVIAPHPDDETIGAYGLIRALRKRSARIDVIVVTDGSGSHRNSRRWPRDRLIAERRRETLSAMRRVGVGPHNVTFLGLPDGGLSRLGEEVGKILQRAAARRGAPDLLLLPAADDDHSDHRAVSTSIRSRHGRTLEYLVWPSRGVRSRRATHCLRLGSIAAAKRGAIRSYRSQTGTITDDPTGFAISNAELARFAHPVERFREKGR